MEIVRVSKGKVHDNTDRIFIDIAATRGRFIWTGSVRVEGSSVWGGAATDFVSVAAAEADAISWAGSRGATVVVIQEFE